MKARTASAVAALVCGLSLMGSTIASATFIISAEDGDEAKFFINGANKGVTSFHGSVGKNNATDFVDVTTKGAVDTGNGYANIKPIKGGTLKTLTFTPTSGHSYDGMFFRGQITGVGKTGFDGDVFATIVDSLGNTTNLTWTGVPDKKDFTTLGFDEPAIGPASIIKSVTLSLDSTGVFKEVKQIDFSGVASGVPEPSTWTMMMLGFAGLGLMYTRTRKRASAAVPT